MKVKIVGYERNRGFSKKKNADYDYHVLHTSSIRPFTAPGCSGYAVQTIVIAHSQGIITDVPTPGETWEISYNPQGKVDDAYAVEG